MTHWLFKGMFLFFCFVPKFSWSHGVLLDNYHYIEKCVKIVNADTFPGVSFIETHLSGKGAPTLGMVSLKKPLSRAEKARRAKKRAEKRYRELAGKNRVVEVGKCLATATYEDLRVFAVQSFYLKSKGLGNVDFRHDPNVLKSNIQFDTWGGQVKNDNSLQKEWLEYTILGFQGNALIVYLSKKTELHVRKSLNQQKGNLSATPKSNLKNEYVVKTYRPPETANLRLSFEGTQ